MVGKLQPSVKMQHKTIPLIQEKSYYGEKETNDRSIVSQPNELKWEHQHQKAIECKKKKDEKVILSFFARQLGDRLSIVILASYHMKELEKNDLIGDRLIFQNAQGRYFIPNNYKLKKCYSW